MSEPKSPRTGDEPGLGEQPGRRRMRKRVRTRQKASARFRKWWDRNGNTALLWGLFLLASLLVILLVMTGFIRGPAPPG